MPPRTASAWSSRSSRCSPNLSVGREHLSRRRARLHDAAGWCAGARSTPPPRASSTRSRSTIDPATPTAELDFAARQMVELAKALTLEEQAEGHLVILLDEPTSVLEQADIDILFERVRALKARASFVFVSHRLDEVLALSDRVYVMKDGRVVAELAAAEADVHQLHQLMVGRGRQCRVLPRILASGRIAPKVLLAAEEPCLDGAVSGRRLRAARRRDPRHRRRDRLRPRGGLPHAVRLRAADLRAPAGRRPAGAPCLALPMRSTTASATSRASGAPRAWCCSCRSSPT